VQIGRQSADLLQVLEVSAEEDHATQTINQPGSKYIGQGGAVEAEAEQGQDQTPHG
jgi:hypothetical protein